MKRLFIVCILACTFCVQGQNKQGTLDDAGRLALTVYVPEQQDAMPAAAKTNLENKLRQIITKQGLSGLNNQRFIITAHVAVLTKDVTSTAPPMQAYTLEVTLYIGDGIAGTLFASTSVTLKGVGDTETKAYMAALKNLKTDDPKYQSFIETGKNKIIEYFNTQCDFIIKESEMLASQNNYEAAIANLMSIPQVSKDCYHKAMNAAQPIYQKQINRDCQMKLQQATGIWNAAQDMEAAQKAGALLATIEPDAACFGEVKALSKKIEAKVSEIDKREWNYILKDQAQESERIEAIRAIGVAFGKNQPQNVTYRYSWW